MVFDRWKDISCRTSLKDAQEILAFFKSEDEKKRVKEAERKGARKIIKIYE